MFKYLRNKLKGYLKKKNVWLASDWYQMPDFDLDKDIIMEMVSERCMGLTLEDVTIIHTYGGVYQIGIILDKTKGAMSTLSITEKEYDEYSSSYVKRKKRNEVINKILT